MGGAGGGRGLFFEWLAHQQQQASRLRCVAACAKWSTGLASGRLWFFKRVMRALPSLFNYTINILNLARNMAVGNLTVNSIYC